MSVYATHIYSVAVTSTRMCQTCDKCHYSAIHLPFDISRRCYVEFRSIHFAIRVEDHLVKVAPLFTQIRLKHIKLFHRMFLGLVCQMLMMLMMLLLMMMLLLPMLLLLLGCLSGLRSGTE